MSIATARAYRSRCADWFMPIGNQKSPEIKTFRENQNTYSGNAHCIKDRILLGETYRSGGFMAWAKNKSEVIWSEQRSI